MAKQTEQVRLLARDEYIQPARRRHDLVVRVVAGDVQKALGLHQRTPLICAALKSRKFLEENHLELEKVEGPPSGISTAAVFTYRLLDEGPGAGIPAENAAFLGLRGIAREVFASLGGGEAFLQKERADFHGPEVREKEPK